MMKRFYGFKADFKQFEVNNNGHNNHVVKENLHSLQSTGKENEWITWKCLTQAQTYTSKFAVSTPGDWCMWEKH